MPFELRESMINDYWSQGYVVFRRVLPASLLRDLRVEGDKARSLARELHGPQAQRLQPVIKHADRLNLKPFQEYAELPVLRDAVRRLFGDLGPGVTVTHSTTSLLGILVEPSQRPRHFGWHRDLLSDVPLKQQRDPEVLKIIAQRWHSPTVANQVNCAIYPDPCLWFVPGSQARSHDLPGEKQCFCYRTEQNPWDRMEGSHAELEARFLDGAYSFPGAVRVYLDPGDFVVYRNLGWHTGLYTTHTPRATLHDSIAFERRN
jgi:hypothetical protein